MKTIIHEIDKKTKRIHFTYPPAKNLLKVAAHHFTKKQKNKAKAEHQTAFKNRHRNSSYWSQRSEILRAILETKNTPNFNLIVKPNKVA